MSCLAGVLRHSRNTTSFLSSIPPKPLSTRSYPDAYHAPAVAVEERVLGRVVEVVGVARLAACVMILRGPTDPLAGRPRCTRARRASSRPEFRGDHHVFFRQSFQKQEQLCSRIGLPPSASRSRSGVLGESQEPSETAPAMLGVPGLPGSVFRAPGSRRVHGQGLPGSVYGHIAD